MIFFQSFSAQTFFPWISNTARACANRLALRHIKVSAEDILAPEAHAHDITPVSWATALIQTSHDDGNVSHGVRIDRPGAKATVLYFGGNGFTIDQYGIHTEAAFRDIPVNVVVYDRRGYGRTSGTRDVHRWKQDAEEIYQQTLKTEACPVFVHGHSLGSFITSHLVATFNPPWVVLEAPGTTVTDVVRARLPWGLRPFVRVSLSSDLADINTPHWLSKGTSQVAILKGMLDTTLPPRMVDAIAKSLPPERVRTIVCDGAGHETMGPLGHFTHAYTPWLTALGESA